MSTRSEIARGASSAFLVKVLAAGAGFSLNIVVARLLGATGAGAFYLSFTFVTFLSTVGRLGLDNLLVRTVAAHASAKEHEQMFAVEWSALKRIIFASSTLALILIIFAPLVRGLLFDESTPLAAIIFMAAAIVPTAIFNMKSYALLGLKRATEAIILMNLIAPLFAALLCIIIAPRFGLVGTSVAYLTAASACASLAIKRWPSRAGKKVNATVDNLRALRAFWGAAPEFLWISLCQQVILWMPTLALGYFSVDRDVGIYSAANRTAMVLIFILVATNSVVGPKLAEACKKEDMQALASIVRNSSALMVVAAAPLIGLIEIFAERIMTVFGPDFSSGAIILRVMAVGLFINIAAGPVGHVLLMCGGEKEMKKIFAFSASATVILSALLIRVWGGLGAGIVTSGVLALQALAAAIVVRRKYGIRIV